MKMLALVIALTTLNVSFAKTYPKCNGSTWKTITNFPCYHDKHGVLKSPNALQVLEPQVPTKVESKAKR